MATFRDRLPSRHYALLLFAICAFPVHVWYIVNLLRELPARMYDLNVWDLVGMSAYVLVFATS